MKLSEIAPVVFEDSMPPNLRGRRDKYRVRLATQMTALLSPTEPGFDLLTPSYEDTTLLAPAVAPEQQQKPFRWRDFMQSSLRLKTLLVVLCALAGLIVILLIPVRTVLMTSFLNLESKSISNNVGRVLDTLDAQLDEMLRTSVDWAYWDDTYSYAEGNYLEYMDVDAPPALLEGLNLDVIGIYTRDGTPRGVRAYSAEKNALVAPPVYFTGREIAAGPLLRPGGSPSGVKGFLALPEGLLMVTAMPVTGSDKRATSPGTLVMGRFITQEEIGQISRTSHLDNIVLRPLGVAAASEGTPEGALYSRLLSEKPGSIDIQRPSDSEAVGSALVRDLVGNPAFIVRVALPRNIYSEGTNALVYFTVLLVVAGFVFCGVILALIERMVLFRVAKLSNQLGQISLAGAPGARVRVEGKDELAQLSGAVNQTLETLEGSTLARSEVESHFRALVQQTSEGIVLLNVEDLRLLDVNDAFIELLGYTYRELLTKTFYDVIAEDKTTLRLRVKEVLRAKRLRLGEYHLYRKDGTALDVEIGASCLKHMGSNVLSFVIHDLTERKRAEEESIRRRSEEYFRSLVQNAADVISIISPEGSIKYASPSVEVMLGYTAEELTGRSALDYIYAEDAEEVTEMISALGGTRDTPRRANLRIQHKDGTWRHLEVIAANLADNPNVTGVLLNIRDVSERKALEDKLAHQAFHDPLTGLPNRALFTGRVERALGRMSTRGLLTAVLFLDLDNFKVINDSLGHQAGDLLLLQVADRLLNAVTPDATVARFGGDEFTILLENVRAEEDVTRTAELLLANLSKPVMVEGHEIKPSASIGVMVSTPGTSSPDEFLRNADIALYKAKMGGKSQFVIFDSMMNEAARERLDMEIELRQALAQKQLIVYYQPIVDMARGRVTDLEALVRWQHPQRGIVQPSDFIPLAEEIGLIVEIGRWVLEQVCLQAVRWQRERVVPPTMTFSVNVSARQFQQPHFPAVVAETLRRSGLNPRCLKLEITESIGMDDLEATLETLEQLKAIGVQLALDDFGMGYSALGYLRRFPIDTVKLDRVFISGLGRNRGDTAIVFAAISFAHAMNLTVTGEGVETPEQFQMLQSLGCDYAQGFLLSRPLPPEALVSFLSTIRRQLPRPREAFRTEPLSGDALRTEPLEVPEPVGLAPAS